MTDTTDVPVVRWTDGPAVNILWSYAYSRKLNIGEFLDTLPVGRVRYFADSGAFSAKTLGIDIGVHDYGEWLARNEDHLTIYCNLDVIGAPETTWKNQKVLEGEYGLSPMPVFHAGSPFSALQRYLDAGYTYIALGKGWGRGARQLRPWLDQCFNMASGRAVFHGFGLTIWQLLREFPFYSVDSSSYTAGFRYGLLPLFDRGRWVNVQMRNRDHAAKYRRLLSSYGVGIAGITKDGAIRETIGGACAVARYRANDYLQRIHGPVRLPPGKGYPDPTTPTRGKVIRQPTRGLQTYLADTTERSHRFISARLADDIKSGYPYIADMQGT